MMCVLALHLELVVTGQVGEGDAMWLNRSLDRCSSESKQRYRRIVCMLGKTGI